MLNSVQKWISPCMLMTDVLLAEGQAAAEAGAGVYGPLYFNASAPTELSSPSMASPGMSMPCERQVKSPF